MADGRWLARDQNKGFNAHKERSPTQEALRDELLRACLPAVRGGLKRCHALTAKSGMSVAIRHARNTQSLRETFQSKKKQKESRKSFKIQFPAMFLKRAKGKDAEMERNDGARISGKLEKAPYMPKLQADRRIYIGRKNILRRMCRERRGEKEKAQNKRRIPSKSNSNNKGMAK